MVIRNRSKRIIKINQTFYLKIVLERIEIEYNKYKPTKLPINGYSSLRPTRLDNERTDPE